MIRVLVVLPNHELPPKTDSPGISGIIHRQLEAVSDKDIQITALSQETDYGSSIHEKTSYQSIVIPMAIRWNLLRCLPAGLRKRFYGISSYPKLKRSLNIYNYLKRIEDQFDVIILHNYMNPVVWLGKFTGNRSYKLIYYFHQSGFAEKAGAELPIIEKCIDGLITISGEEVKQTAFVSVNIYNNYVKMLKLPDQQSNNEEKFRLVCTSNIDFNKGVHILVNAVDQLLERGLKIELDIYGKIIDRDCFDEIKDILNKREEISYNGYLHNSELLPRLRQFDLLVQLSQDVEGNSMSVIEALVEGGIPVYASNVGGIPLVLNYGRFGMIEEEFRNSQIVAESLIRLMEDRDRLSLYKSNIEAEADEYFSPEKSAETLSKFIKQIA